jgi:hypothetical protein
MSREVTSTTLDALFAQQTDKIVLLLLTISHTDLDTPIRVVNNTQNITSRGNEYIGFPFSIELPGSSADQLPRVQLTICNVDRQIIIACRSITGPPTVTLEAIRADDPDTLLLESYEFQLIDIEADALVVTGTLAFEPILDEPYPGYRFTPEFFPGLFEE